MQNEQSPLFDMGVKLTDEQFIPIFPFHTATRSLMQSTNRAELGQGHTVILRGGSIDLRIGFSSELGE